MCRSLEYNQFPVFESVMGSGRWNDCCLFAQGLHCSIEIRFTITASCDGGKKRTLIQNMKQGGARMEIAFGPNLLARRSKTSEGVKTNTLVETIDT